MFNSSVAIQLMSTLFNKATVQIFISGKECSRGAADPDATCGRHRSGASGGARCSGLPLVTRGLLEAGWGAPVRQGQGEQKGHEAGAKAAREAAPDSP